VPDAEASGNNRTSRSFWGDATLCASGSIASLTTCRGERFYGRILECHATVSKIKFPGETTFKIAPMIGDAPYPLAYTLIVVNYTCCSVPPYFSHCWTNENS